ncbi:TIGR03086 family metal-binding protein [uncultured Friedmanniella sp.]|uniref:TIGR03086 family metal-binding protein n=1 Tax=uncultured Friedmanniella sp. TaxID=335381 RepID=UPI0035CA0A18
MTAAPERHDLLDQLTRAVASVDALVAGVRPEQWSAPTPCSEWTVRRLVGHLSGMNRVFVALLAGQRPPRPGEAPEDADPVAAFRTSAASLQTAFAAPGTLERTFAGPMGSATGAERLQIRLYDLLAHGWDLAVATGQPVAMPEDVAEHALTFVRGQLSDDARPGRFDAARPVADDAPAINRLVAFLGRAVSA